MNAPCFKAARGFSLLEMLLVLTIMALMVGIAATSLSRSVGGAEVRAAGRDIAAGLRYARSQAMVRKEPMAFHVDGNERAWKAADKPAKKIPDDMEITLQTGRSLITGENAGYILFYPDGSSTGGNVTISTGDLHWDVGVAWLTGRIKMAPPEGPQ